MIVKRVGRLRRAVLGHLVRVWYDQVVPKKLPPSDWLPRAEVLARHAVAELGSGDPAMLQNAAGKAWAAARMAAKAVVLCEANEKPRGTTTLRKRVTEIAKTARGRRHRELLQDFRGDFGDAFADLHVTCGENGDCDRTGTARGVRMVERDLVPTAQAICRRAP